MRRRSRLPPPPPKFQHRINHRIRAREVRVVGPDGEQKGILQLRDALRMAEEAELDLVEIAPNADPPVCRIEDYKKVLYEKKKRDKAAKKKQKVIEVKEVKVRPNCDVHDFDIKMKRALKFLEDGSKVKVTMMFRGREIPTAEQRSLVLRDRVEAAIGQYGTIESFSRASVRQKVMMLAPTAAAKAAAEARAKAALASGRPPVDDDDEEDHDDHLEHDEEE